MSIEELATPRDNATAKLLEKVAVRQGELAAELERLSQYGKQVKRAVAATPFARTKESLDKATDEMSETKLVDTSVAEAA